jgi:hypothetical protein
MSNTRIVDWIKKNFQILELLLLVLAVILLICIVVKVPLECYNCLRNPMNYYEVTKNTTCWCENMKFSFGA